MLARLFGHILKLCDWLMQTQAQACWSVKRQLTFADQRINFADAIVFGFQSATTPPVYGRFNEWLTLAVLFIVDIVVKVSSARTLINAAS